MKFFYPPASCLSGNDSTIARRKWKVKVAGRAGKTKSCHIVAHIVIYAQTYITGPGPIRRIQMESKKFLFVLSHATSNPMEVIVMLKIISNMKAFDDDAEIAVFLVGEGVQLAKKGVGKTITMELEGNLVNVGELLDMMPEFNVKFYVCHAFMPLFSVAKEELIEGAEMKGSSYLGELLLAGYTPFPMAM
jgi:predicted peroxiredoxin